MATAGLAHTIYHGKDRPQISITSRLICPPVPFKFHGLYAIGCTFFILSLVFFVFSCTMMGLRFYWWPSTFKGALMHPNESLFIPAFTISLASVMINIVEYGLGSNEVGVWLLNTLVVFFWIYVVLAIMTSLGIYLTMWSTQTFSLANMTPSQCFRSFSIMTVLMLRGSLDFPRVSHVAHWSAG